MRIRNRVFAIVVGAAFAIGAIGATGGGPASDPAYKQLSQLVGGTWEFTSADLSFPGVTLLVETERIVAEAGLGAVDSARERLERLFELHRTNEGPLTLGELYETGLRVALLARHEADARAHCEGMARWYGVTRIPSLVQHCAIAGARTMAVLEGPPGTDPLLVPVEVEKDDAASHTTAVSAREAADFVVHHDDVRLEALDQEVERLER